ncbi:MAG: methyltransferase [Hyphomicrobium sp.]|nr:methyltransferase [Hyphomicrobium sp.]
MNQIVEHFSDPQAVSRYAEGALRMVPGFVGMQCMTTHLLAERVPEHGRVLVLGAGGGLELKAFAEAHANWTFLGVDPSPAMVELAKQTLGPRATRVTWQTGTIDDVPDQQLDGATCLLTLHFLAPDERRRTAVEVRRRLQPGAPFVVAHHSIPDGAGERDLWLSRFARYGAAAGLEAEKVETFREGIKQHLPILTPEQDETILREAGFSNVSLFYAAFTFRGWVAYA